MIVTKYYEGTCSEFHVLSTFFCGVLESGRRVLIYIYDLIYASSRDHDIKKCNLTLNLTLEPFPERNASGTTQSKL